MKTIQIKRNCNSIFIRLQNDKLVTLLQYNVTLADKAQHIIDNCLSIGYIEIEG